MGWLILESNRVSSERVLRSFEHFVALISLFMTARTHLLYMSTWPIDPAQMIATPSNGHHKQTLGLI